MDLTPTDFISGLGGINNLPNPAQDQAVAQGLHTTQLQQQAAQLQIQQAQVAQQRAQSFQTDLATLGKNPDANGIAGLIQKYPEYAKQMKDAHDIQDEAKKASDFHTQSQIYAAAKGGKYDLAAQLLQQHHDASVAAGEAPDPTDQALIDALKSGDPAEQKNALAMIGFGVASVNPDKFAETYKVLNPTSAHTYSQLGSGGIFDTSTGNVVREPTDRGELREIKVTNPDGSETTQFVRVGGGGMSGGTASGSSPTAALNNPGAIRYDPKNKWQGQVGEQGGFVQFDSPASGQRAHQKLIANQVKAGYDTPLSWAQHYAPESDGNDPQAYAQTVAHGLGIGVNDKIPMSAVPKMAALSARVESMGTPSRGQAQTPPGVVASFQTKGAESGVAPGDTSKTGPEYLATLPPTLAAQVKALSEGRLQIPTGAALRSPQVQQLWAAAAQYDPDLDQANAKTRYATRKAFTSGKEASNITSFNTVLHHMDTLAHAADDLSNTSIPAWNALGNATNNALGDPAVKKFNAAKQAVVDELERAFRGTSGTLAGIKGWEESISSSSSPAQIQGVLTQMADLLAGRIEALGEQYTAGMGKSTDGINLLDSKARTSLKRFGSGYGDADKVAGGGSGGIPQGAVPTGKYYQGKPVYLVNGRKWVP